MDYQYLEIFAALINNNINYLLNDFHNQNFHFKCIFDCRIITLKTSFFNLCFYHFRCFGSSNFRVAYNKNKK
jgi:hypothetical protein